MSPDMSIMQTLDHFYSIWHQRPGDKPGRGLAAGKELIRRHVRRHSSSLVKPSKPPRKNGEIETLDALVEHAANCRCFRCTVLNRLFRSLNLLIRWPTTGHHRTRRRMITLGDGLGVFAGK